MLFRLSFQRGEARLALHELEPVMIETEPEAGDGKLHRPEDHRLERRKYPVLLTLLRRPEVERALIFTT